LTYVLYKTKNLLNKINELPWLFRKAKTCCSAQNRGSPPINREFRDPESDAVDEKMAAPYDRPPLNEP
jgi:hypothetical protein